MTTAPVPRLIRGLAVPTIISMLVTSFYVMADTYFVGKINTQSTAAVGISFSIMAIIQAFGFFCGHGSGNFISRRLGARDYRSAEKMAATGFFSAFLIGYIYAPEVVSWFRKEDPQVIAVGAEALRWQLITLPLGAWVILCNMLLQTIRQPRRAVILSSSRQGLFFIPLILILPYFLQLQGVEMCQAAADLCSFLLALPLTIPVLKSLRIDRTPMKEENA